MARATFVCITLITLSQANEFLKSTPKERFERISEEDVQTSLLEEVEETLGNGTAANRLRLLEAVLKPMYDALPKNEHGNLGHSAVRYALHRLFVMRHGWYIKGLGRHAEDANITSPSGILKDQVPTYIQSIFEKRLGDKGLGLHDLAVMASTLEHLVHKEAVSRLGDVYKIFKKFPVNKVDVNTANEMLDIYMMAFILGEDLSNMTLYEARSLNDDMPTVFSGWHDTQEFVRRIRLDITQKAEGKSLSLDFAALAKVVKAIGEEFGSFQSIECRRLKDTLVNMEFADSGRVRLSDFYKPSLDGGWQFQESVGYLRQLGALDESNLDASSVVLVNYLHSQTNCIASSGYYSVCCKDECEHLIGQLEARIAAPKANPSVIVSLVENMASATVKSSRKLSFTLTKRLQDIADLNGGDVPLHGRLFAQWMHHAYPRECPYPHKAGTTRQKTADEWLLETGTDSMATPEEMQIFTDRVASRSERGDEGIMPWSPEEELLVVCRADMPLDASFKFSSLRPALLFLLAGAFAFRLVHSFQTTSKGGHDSSNSKFLV